MDIARQLAAAALVLGLLAAALWRLRRRGFAGMLVLGKPAGRRLERVERLALGPHHALDLVRMGDRGLLVASYPSGCALIESFPWREVESARETAR
ncbi:MAG: flagellar biosynthetic protein FliO [Bryobacteraceae bacterium]|jgi:flagellar biogenesis protein FliO